MPSTILPLACDDRFGVACGHGQPLPPALPERTCAVLENPRDVRQESIMQKKEIIKVGIVASNAPA